MLMHGPDSLEAFGYKYDMHSCTKSVFITFRRCDFVKFESGWPRNDECGDHDRGHQCKWCVET